jgi:RNA polymerase sigma factor (sigma-70 family)
MAAERDDDESTRLRTRAQAGDQSAIARLVAVNASRLRAWAHGKLPIWVRSFSDTSDLVQDAIARTFARREQIDIGASGALQAYLRQSVRNRIADEHRVVGRRGVAVALSEDRPAQEPSPFDVAASAELGEHYRAALKRLREGDQHLVIGHLELDYSIKQLALLSGRSIGATRMALRRALVRLATEMRHGRSAS